MDSAIDHYQIVEMFVNAGNYNKFKNQFTPIYLSLEKDFPYIFGNRLSKVLINFQLTYAFHDWFLRGQDKKELEKMMGKFINMINYPFDLVG
jgi:hypothetical protein